MPSVTSVSSYELVNIGPLTTTFTAPKACATAKDVYLGTPSDPEGAVYYRSECDMGRIAKRSSCYPSGPSADAARNPLDASIIAYYSPGLFCPESWTTVGVAVKDGKGSISASGFFAPSTEIQSKYAHLNPPPSFLMGAMEEGETVIACCPSGFGVNPWGFYCHSTADNSLYSASEGCRYHVTSFTPAASTDTWLFYGTTVTGWLASLPGMEPKYLTTTTLDPNRREELVAMTQVSMVTLAYKAADLADATKTGRGGEPTKTASDESETGAARAGRLTMGSSMGTMTAVWGVTIVAAVVLIVRL